MTDKTTFSPIFRHYCPHCRVEIPHGLPIDAETDTIVCPGCNTSLKLGDGVKGSGCDNPGDLDAELLYRCPGCHSAINEGYIINRGDGQLECPACNFVGAEEGDTDAAAAYNKPAEKLDPATCTSECGGCTDLECARRLKFSEEKVIRCPICGNDRELNIADEEDFGPPKRVTCENCGYVAEVAW